VARHAAKDRRVDLLQFSLTNLYKRFFDEKEAELSSQSLSGLEIELAPILELNAKQKIRIFAKLQKEIVIAQKAKVPIIISSGASYELLMRGPYDYSAFATLFDISFEDSLNAISKNPISIVEKNRGKLSEYFVAPGIKIVGRKICD
jgi:RNase P/RNase MRP subunit p30